jgi:ABC-type polar amino acid transport system ATPase subunit
VKSSINSNLGLSFQDAQNHRVTRALMTLNRAQAEMRKATKDGAEEEAMEELKRHVISCKADVAGAKDAREAGNKYPPVTVR